MARELPTEWAEYGAHFGDDGLLYLSEWRRGFTVHELRATFFECQLLKSQERQIRQLEADQAELQRRLDQAERRAWWYRRQLVAESRLGLALQRITAD